MLRPTNVRQTRVSMAAGVMTNSPHTTASVHLDTQVCTITLPYHQGDEQYRTQKTEWSILDDTTFI